MTTQQALTFEQWFQQVTIYADTKGFLPRSNMTTWEIAYWHDLYDRGFVPSQAWDYEPPKGNDND